MKRQGLIDNLIAQLQADFPIFRKKEQLSLHLITESKHFISQSQEMKKLISENHAFFLQEPNNTQMGSLSNVIDLTIKQLESDIKQFQEIIDLYRSFPTLQKEQRQSIVKQLLLIKQRSIESEHQFSNVLVTYTSLK